MSLETILEFIKFIESKGIGIQYAILIVVGLLVILFVFAVLKDTIVAVLKDKLNNKKIITIKSIAPRPTPNFIGRDKEIDEIENHIQENEHIVLVSGMGGIGKSEICKKLFHKLKNDGQIKHIGWVVWDGRLKNTLVSNFKNANKSFEKIREHINYLADSLLLFIDNMNDVPSEIDKLELENLGCNIVITSRCEKIYDWLSYPIHELSEDDCVLIYKKNVNRSIENKIVCQIIKKANNLTIVVELLAKTAREAGLKDFELLEELNKCGFNLVNITEKIDRKTFYEHLEKLFDVSKINKTELAMLKKFSLFPPIPLEHKTLKRWLEQKNLNVLNVLANKGWLIKTETGFYMHPVISDVVRNEKPPEYEECTNLVNMIGKDLHFEPPEIFTPLLRILPFGENVIKHFPDAKDENIVCLINSVATLYMFQSKDDEALKLFRKVLAIRKKNWGTAHKLTAETYHDVANVHSYQGEYEEAFKFYNKALTVFKDFSGKERYFTAEIYRHMAKVYSCQGEYDKALEFYDKAFSTVCGTFPEKERFSIAKIYNGKGIVYKSKGEYDEALRFYNKTLEIYEKLQQKQEQGQKHPDFAMTYCNMAEVYRCQGECNKALEFYDKALPIFEKFIVKHPETAKTYKAIAEVHFCQGDYDKALQYVNSYRLFIDKFGADHQNSKACKQDMEKVYAQSGKTAKFDIWLGEQLNSHLNIGESL